MNKYIAFSAVVLLVLCIEPTPSVGLQCWDCNSAFETKCVDPFVGGEPSYTLKKKECDSNQVCWKMGAKVAGVQGINRGCQIAPPGITDECQSATKDSSEASNCYCSSDLCNGGEKTTTAMSVLALLTAGVIGKLVVNYFH